MVSELLGSREQEESELREAQGEVKEYSHCFRFHSSLPMRFSLFSVMMKGIE